MSISNQENFLLATEILNEIKKNSDKIDYNQRGGFVFSLIAYALDVFKDVAKGIAKGLYALGPWLVNGHIFIKTDEVKKDEDGHPLRDAKGELIYKKRFSPGVPEGEGNLWKYLWFCIKTSLYLVIFALGGFWVTILAIVFIYTKLAGKFKKMRYGDVDD